MNTLVIPCSDCEATRQRLERSGFRVEGCTAHSDRPQLCVISFERRSAALAPAEGAERTAVPTGEPPRGRGAFLTDSQIRTAQAIVNLFETSEVLGRYDKVTLIEGDTGRLTYGRSQTTLGSGNLNELLERYCANPGARFADRLRPYLPNVAAKADALDHDALFQNILRAAADDRVMREVQDRFFDDRYWQPAVRSANRLGISTPLGVAVVYDSFVHGAWDLVRKKVDTDAGAINRLGERAWIAAYVDARHVWLATHNRSDLRATVYRMQAFRRLIEQGFWGLELPLVVRDAEISVVTLAGVPPNCYDGPQPGTRPLGLQQPLARGLDVRLLQLALSERGMEIKADGVFGQASFNAVKAFQIVTAQPATGIANVELISSLVL